MVGEDYPEPDIMWNRYGTTSGSYPDLDRFNRVTSSRWTTDLGTDVDFYDIDITYDRNSNITLIEDNVHVGFDVDYTNDNLNRLTKAEEGTWGGSSISSRTRNQEWTLDQVGNWDVGKLDLDGDNNYNETDEYNDDRTHNVVNELTARDTDDDGTDDFTLTYDAVGNLTDDGENYEYVYDVFGRLRKINDTTDQSLVAEYRYNGLGYKISQHQDTDTDGDVDASDKWFHGVYDTNWRMVGIFRDDDTDPKEQFVHHNAGADGFGGSSYIDRVILRDRDNTNGPTGAPDGTLEERRYYCQNLRQDVSAVVTSGGVLVEWGKYSSYGVPFGLPGADTDSDGDCDSTDITQIQTWINASTYDVRADLDLDGDVDSADKTTAQNNYQGTTLGWNVMSGVRRQHGYAGYEWDAAVSKCHVRNRVLDPHLGRWTRRDPLGYVDGTALYVYASAAPVTRGDPFGLSVDLDDLPSACSLAFFDPSVAEALLLVALKCKFEPKLRCCPPGTLCCQNGRPLGCFDHENPEYVCICTNTAFSPNHPDYDEQVDTILHELTHMWQYCACITNKDDPDCEMPGRPWDFKLLDLCTEIGALCSEINGPPATREDCASLCFRYGNFGLGTYCTRACHQLWDRCCDFRPGL